MYSFTDVGYNLHINLANYIYIYISKVKLATVVEDDSRHPFPLFLHRSVGGGWHQVLFSEFLV